MAPRNTGRSTSATILPFPQAPAPRRDRILRISPEYEGHCLLYAHHALSRDKLFAIRILCWAELEDGRYVALVPWLNGIARCCDLKDPDSGQAQGYYAPAAKRPFNRILPHQQAALEQLPREGDGKARGVILQEIPDLIGSHAAILEDKGQRFELEPVISWQLDDDGRMTAMLADIDKATQFPVLAGDPCLYAAQQRSGFRYFFQYHIANQIKAGGEVATRALQQLLR